jgi:malonyl-CoA O-methyltransferase
MFDRRRIAASFDRASGGYDAAAALQAEVRAELMERLRHFARAPRTLLDLGAGTGAASAALAREYPQALVVAFDLAPGMLREAARRMSARDRVFGGRFGHPFGLVQGDAFRLPFADAAFDIVFSSLMLQWCDDLDAALAEARRVLRPGGVFTFSSFGPGTLRELRDAWSAADAAPHVSPFVDVMDLGSALGRVGFAEPVLDVDRHVTLYPAALTLMRELKAIGAHNALSERPRGLTGRGRLAVMTAAYEMRRRADGQLPASWEVVYATTFAPAQSVPGNEASGAASTGGEVTFPAGRVPVRSRR